MPQANPGRTPHEALSWRDAVATASGLNFLLGIWLMSAPYVLAYDDGQPRWSDIAFGALIAVLAFIRATKGSGRPLLSYLNVLLGTWVFAAAFWAYDIPRAAWNDLIIGAAVAILAVLSATADEDPASAERVWYQR